MARYEIVAPNQRILIDAILSENPLAPCGPDDPERILAPEPGPHQPGPKHGHAHRS